MASLWGLLVASAGASAAAHSLTNHAGNPSGVKISMSTDIAARIAVQGRPEHPHQRTNGTTAPSAPPAIGYVLVGDIGGTNTRLALYDLSVVDARDLHTFGDVVPALESHEKNFRISSLTDHIKHFIEGSPGPIVAGSLSVAGPVKDNTVTLSNKDWVISGDSLSKDLSINRLHVVNDFIAAALGVLTLKDSEVETVQRGSLEAGAPKAVVGAGTGLGEAYLTQGSGHQYTAFPSEGGHADFAPQTEEQAEMLKYFLRNGAWHNHVSVERVVSGLGIASIFDFLAHMATSSGRGVAEQDKDSFELVDQGEPSLRARRIAEQAEKGCQICKHALDMFFSAYGAEIGNVALKFRPQGGLYIAGGIMGKHRNRLKNRQFIEAITNKGRLSGVAKSVPVYFVSPANLGLRGALVDAVRLATEPPGIEEQAVH